MARQSSTRPRPAAPRVQPEVKHRAPRDRSLLWCCLAALAVLVAYANHFQNEFHFDDFHTIPNNPFIRELGNIPRFFVDPKLFSIMPDHATWRPLVSVSLAIDYWIGHSLKPFVFHLSTFVWFEVQLGLMFFLFRRIMNLTDPHASNVYLAVAATAFYGLHPANAETVNYVIQRADLYSTLGVVASLLWFIAYPKQRKFGWYLLPALAAYLSKAPALIYPFILLAYILVFEHTEGGVVKRWAKAVRATIPALLVTGAAAVVTRIMTPPTFAAGAASGSMYRLTQPWVALHYFKSFFLPTDLSADTDWGYVSSPFSAEALAGYFGVALLIALAIRLARSRETRPIAFGLFWFFLALVPTSLMPLAEVTNDHRMFFPFVGLSLAVFWALRLALFHKTARLAVNRSWLKASVAGLLAVFVLEAAGTWQRNDVWHTEESLWRDVTIKSPHNGRGLMNYGLIFMARGDYQTALQYYDRALRYTPNYWALEINTAVALGAIRRDAEAEAHFHRAETLAPAMADPYFYYGRWLKSVGRINESAAQLEAALRVNGLFFDARHLLMEVYSQQGNWNALDRLAHETLQMAPDDETAQKFLADREYRGREVEFAEEAAKQKQTPDAWLELSHQYYRAGRFTDCITAARQALKLHPEYPEAYNNLSAAYNALHQWDDGIAAAQKAVQLKPDDQLAKNNLQWALKGKQQMPR